MACPYFVPLEPLAGARKAPLPLGDAHTGYCQADVVPFYPDAAALQHWCNLGYARGECARFPHNGGPDAVRFSVAQDRGGLIRLCCVREKDHRPFDHGSLEYAVARNAFTLEHADRMVQVQAQAYLASYLRRRQERP